MGMDVRGCRCNPRLTPVKDIVNGSLTTQQISAQPSSHSRDMEKGCSSAHVQMHPTDDLWDTCSLNTHQIWSQSVKSFLSYSLRPGHTCTAHGLRTKNSFIVGQCVVLRWAFVTTSPSTLGQRYPFVVIRWVRRQLLCMFKNWTMIIWLNDIAQFQMKL